MTNSDVQGLIDSIRATRDKLSEEIRPQEEAIAETKAEIARLDAMLAAYTGETTVAETAPASNGNKPERGAKPDATAILRYFREATKSAADDEKVDGFVYLRTKDAVTGTGWKGADGKMRDALNELVTANKLVTNEKPGESLRAGKRYALPKS